MWREIVLRTDLWSIGGSDKLYCEHKEAVRILVNEIENSRCLSRSLSVEGNDGTESRILTSSTKYFFWNRKVICPPVRWKAQWWTSCALQRVSSNANANQCCAHMSFMENLHDASWQRWASTSAIFFCEREYFFFRFVLGSYLSSNEIPKGRDQHQSQNRMTHLDGIRSGSEYISLYKMKSNWGRNDMIRFLVFRSRVRKPTFRKRRCATKDKIGWILWSSVKSPWPLDKVASETFF